MKVIQCLNGWIFGRLRDDSSGATAIEYGLIAGGIALAILTAVGVLGEELIETYSRINSTIASKH